MEWLVPILFVLASLAQWWMQRNRQAQEEEPPSQPTSDKRERSVPPRPEPAPPEEFGDLGDLLEALGRRRHESPPPPIEQTEPPVLPPPAPARVQRPKPEPPPAPVPEPVIVLEPTKPAPATVFTSFPEAKPSPMGEPGAAFVLEEAPRVAFRPFPLAEKPGVSISHRWAERLRCPESIREAVILSEILAPPVALR